MTSYLTETTGIKSWLLTKDHKRIALLFMIATALALMLGGVFAMLIRFELISPGPDFMDGLTYNRLFTHHGVVMMFLFMVPAIPTVFGNFFLPMMLGAPDVALPRLNLASFYVYCAGAIGATGVILGFIFTFTPQFLLGNAGMPRRYWTYPAEYQWLNVASTAGRRSSRSASWSTSAT